MRYLLIWMVVMLLVGTAYGKTGVDSVLVKKSERMMYLLQHGKIGVKRYCELLSSG